MGSGYTFSITPITDGAITVGILSGVGRDVAGNNNLSASTLNLVADVIAPIIVEVTPVLMLTRNNTPSYVFSSTETGTISYSGACTSATTTAIPGNNTITLSSLGDGVHANCTIRVRDAAMNTSNVVTLTSFTIDTTVPTATLQYTPNTSTSGSVIVTLTGASEVITITNNSGASTKTFASNGTFTFLFSDLAGNTGSLLATVSTIDTIAPVVTLSGASTVNIAFASVYTDAGARWTDVVDGSGTLTASGTLNTGVAGTYILIYTKTDVAGNTGTGSRSVTV